MTADNSDAYTEKMKAQLDQAKVELEQAEASLREMEADTQVAAANRMRHLRAQYDTLRAHLGESGHGAALQDESGRHRLAEIWDDFKGALEGLKQTIQENHSRTDE